MAHPDLYVNVGGPHARPNGEIVRQGHILIPTPGELRAFPEKFRPLVEVQDDPKWRRKIQKSAKTFRWPTGNGVTWERVRWQAKRAIILCQGPSFKHVDLGQVREVQTSRYRPRVIAVNGAIDYYPEADFFFTLDPSVVNQKRMRDPIEGVTYVAAVPETYATAKASILHYRAPAPYHVHHLHREEGRGLSEDPGTIFSGNSGWGALGLAYLMGSERIVLVGLDGRGRLRWDGTENLRLDYLPKLFRSALPQLKNRWVVNASPGSSVDCFPILSPGRALEQLCAA